MEEKGYIPNPVNGGVEERDTERRRKSRRKRLGRGDWTRERVACDRKCKQSIMTGMAGMKSPLEDS